MNSIELKLADETLKSDWLKLRMELWPHHDTHTHSTEIDLIIDSNTADAFIAYDEKGEPVGFVECTIRDKAIGCESNNVGYIEGWYVVSKKRKVGLGKQLVKEAETWAVEKGCMEMASDCYCDNVVSKLAHSALGYKQKKCLIHFSKKLSRTKSEKKSKV